MMVVKIKRQNAHKNCAIKINLKFENYRNCLEATQLKNKINYLEKKNKIAYLIYFVTKENIKNS